MGRKSVAQEYYEEFEGEEDGEGTWLVIYDFRAGKPNPRFWGNMRRLMGLLDGGEFIQYSVFRTESKRGALTAAKVAVHYGAEVVLFRGEMVDAVCDNAK